MADLDVWKDYVTVINAARLNAIRDHIITNEGNISYQQTLINANSTSIHNNVSGINYNADKIANLSDIKLSRDGSQPMEGELICNNGLKTNKIDTVSGGVIRCQKDLQIDTMLVGSYDDGLLLQSDIDVYAPYMRFYPESSSENGAIFIGTPGSPWGPVSRIEIPGNAEIVDIKIKSANLIPANNGELSIGKDDKKWNEIYALKGYFSELTAGMFYTSLPRNMPFYLENPSSSDKYLLGAGTVSTMYQFNSTVTLIGYKLMMLTSASNGYIKVTIDDANGWSYEKTYNLGSAGGYRYNESFTHIIETDNGIQLKVSNCSQISSTSLVLEYK